MAKNKLVKITVSLAMAAVMTVAGFSAPGNGDMSSYRIFAATSEDDATEVKKTADKSFFEAHGLTESKETSFILKTYIGDRVTVEDIEETEMPVEYTYLGENVISGTGRKDVKAYFSFDNPVTDTDKGVHAWFSAFDRDTGICFESAGAEKLDVFVKFDWEADENDNEYAVAVTVNCPEDYYGTVFYCSGGNSATHAAELELDFDNESYTIDELPYFANDGKDNFYFIASDKADTKKAAVEKKDIKDSANGNADGTITVGDSTVSFGSGSGQALLIEDTAPLPDSANSNGYMLVLDEDAPSEVKISMKADEPKDGAVTRIKLGFPCVDQDGNEDFLWIPADTVRKGNTVSTQIDLKDYEGVVDDFQFNGTAQFEDEALDAGKRLVNAADAKAMGVKYTVRYFSENVFEIMSPGKKFQINLPESLYNDDTVDKKKLFKFEDMERLGEDMESLLAEYKEEFTKNTRSKWPVMVEDCPYKDAVGGYGCGLTQNGCVMYLKFASLGDGYKRGGTYDGGSNSMYHTLAHELFHFIQWEYTNKSLRSLWFDEATAVYYEDEKGDTAGIGSDNNYRHDALRQYFGITPSSTFFVLSDSAEKDGYGRRALIEYLVQTFGDDFMSQKIMPNYTVKSSGKPIEDMLTKQTEKTMAELTRDYYYKLVGTNELKGRFIEPWEITRGTVDGYGERLPKELYTRADFTGKGKEQFSFPLPRYGVHFVSIEGKNLPAKYESFDVTLDTPNTTAILFDIYGETYEDISVYRSWEEGLDYNYVEGHSYLLMVINESDTNYGGGSMGGTASISVKVHDMNEDLSGSFPDKPEKIAAECEGYVTRRVAAKRGPVTVYNYEDVAATAKISLNQSGTMSVRVTSNETGEELMKGQLQYNSSTGQASNSESSLQFERGNYDEDGELMTVRIHDNYATGGIHMVFDGLIETVEQKKEEKPLKVDYSGSYNCEEEQEDYMGFGVTGFRTAFDNALSGITVSVGKDGSFSGSGSYSASYDAEESWDARFMKAPIDRKESVSVTVSISGKVGEDGKGTFKITGSGQLSGNGSGKAAMDDPSDYNYTKATRTEDWKYNYSLSIEGDAEMTEWDNKNGNRVPALFLSFDGEAIVNGNYEEHEVHVFPNNTLWDDVHYDYSDPLNNKEWVYSGLFIYLK
ncbi:MAG: hypothetical protein K6G22_04890 [Lachnospiraceae bacterium]|nr:hypothetical protein [Lachnospiraceae bacterium]